MYQVDGIKWCFSLALVSEYIIKKRCEKKKLLETPWEDFVHNDFVYAVEYKNLFCLFVYSWQEYRCMLLYL